MVFSGFLVFYVLSVGPAYRMAARRVIPQAWFVGIYNPVIYIGESVPFIHGAFDWYMKLWHDYTRAETSRL